MVLRRDNKFFNVFGIFYKVPSSAGASKHLMTAQGRIRRSVRSNDVEGFVIIKEVLPYFRHARQDLVMTDFAIGRFVRIGLLRLVFDLKNGPVRAQVQY